MDKYQIAFQILAILCLCYLGYLFIKLIVAQIKKNRLLEFSLDIDNTDKQKSLIFKIIYNFSSFLDSLVIFNMFAKTYDKYIYDDSRLKKGMNYIAIKVLLGLTLILLYLFMMVLYRDTFSSLILILCFIIGFIIPDFYCLLIKRKRNNILNKNILGAIIIMSNSYKANGSTEQAILDVINRTDNEVSYEFKKVLNDINIGIDVSEAFYRMYLRCNNLSIKYISNVLKLVNKSEVSLIDAFNVIENKLIEKEKFNNEVKMLKTGNKVALLLFAFLPFIFIISIIIYNESYMNLFIGYLGTILLAIILIMYLFYLLVIHRIYRGGNNDK